MKYFKALKLYSLRNLSNLKPANPSSLKPSKPTNLNKSKLKPSHLSLRSKYMKQCMSLFICAHLIASPCVYALESASHSALESTTAQFTQSIPAPPHTTQSTLLQSTTLAEQISTAQSSTPQLLAPHASQPALPQTFTPQLDTLQSYSELHTPPPSTPILESNLPSKIESIDSALQNPLQSPLPQIPPLQNPPLQDSLPPHLYALESNTSLQDSLPIDSRALKSSESSLKSLDSALQSHYLQESNSLDSHLQEHSLLDSLPITPDTSTPSLSPTITHSPNDIEIINITTPNSKGISNNHYIDFNIKPKGAILNNSLQSITSTHLAGLISSNPHLKDSSASLILNQVTSANPSYLLGMLEVAGDKASVLIANPNGIVCKSCEFGNVANLALSTALIEDKLTLDEKWLNNTTSTFASTPISNPINTPANTINPIHTTNPTNNTSPTNTNDINTISNTNTTSNASTTNSFNNANPTSKSHQSPQSLQEQLKRNLFLRVQKGHINIDSLNASNTTTLTLLSKSLKINKALYANYLSILLGRNDISLSDKGALLLWQPLQIPNTPSAKSNTTSQHNTSPHLSSQTNANLQTNVNLQRSISLKSSLANQVSQIDSQDSTTTASKKLQIPTTPKNPFRKVALSQTQMKKALHSNPPHNP